MLRIPVVLAVTARLIRYFSLTLLVPLAVAVYDQSMPSVVAFIVACLIGTALGFLGGVRFQPPRLFHRPEAMAPMGMSTCGHASLMRVFGTVMYLHVSRDCRDHHERSGSTAIGKRMVHFHSGQFGPMAVVTVVSLRSRVPGTMYRRAMTVGALPMLAPESNTQT